jgi:hypothetical protein
MSMNGYAHAIQPGFIHRPSLCAGHISTSLTVHLHYLLRGGSWACAPKRPCDVNCLRWWDSLACSSNFTYVSLALSSLQRRAANTSAHGKLWAYLTMRGLPAGFIGTGWEHIFQAANVSPQAPFCLACHCLSFFFCRLRYLLCTHKPHLLNFGDSSTLARSMRGSPDAWNTLPVSHATSAVPAIGWRQIVEAFDWTWHTTLQIPATASAMRPCNIINKSSCACLAYFHNARTE